MNDQVIEKHSVRYWNQLIFTLSLLYKNFQNAHGF